MYKVPEWVLKECSKCIKESKVLLSDKVKMSKIDKLKKVEIHLSKAEYIIGVLEENYLNSANDVQ